MYAFLCVRRAVCVRACPYVRVWVCGCETDRQTDRDSEIGRQTETDRHRQTDRQTDRELWDVLSCQPHGLTSGQRQVGGSQWWESVGAP